MEYCSELGHELDYPEARRLLPPGIREKYDRIFLSPKTEKQETDPYETFRRMYITYPTICQVLIETSHMSPEVRQGAEREGVPVKQMALDMINEGGIEPATEIILSSKTAELRFLQILNTDMYRLNPEEMEFVNKSLPRIIEKIAGYRN